MLFYACWMGQSLGCYLAGISFRFVWLSSFCYYACWVGQSTWLALSLVSLVLMLGGFLALLFLCWLRRSVIGLLLGWQFLSHSPSPRSAKRISESLSTIQQTFCTRNKTKKNRENYISVRASFSLKYLVFSNCHVSIIKKKTCKIYEQSHWFASVKVIRL